MMTVFEVIETVAVVLCMFTIAGAIHRLYFHRLAQTPGLKLAALTWWRESYFDGIEQGNFVFKIQELHKEYSMTSSTAFVLG